MKFIAEDGKIFNTLEECQEHEDTLIKDAEIDAGIATMMNGKYMPIKEKTFLRKVIKNVLTGNYTNEFGIVKMFIPEERGKEII